MSKTDLALPWAYDGHDHYCDSGGRYRNILNANGNEVTGEYSNVSHEEAEFIVRAVNSHDALVSALKGALSVIDDYLDYEHNGDPWTEDARAMGEMDIDDYGCDGRMETAREALAEAEKPE